MRKKMTCRHCGESKPPNAFPPNPACRSGFSPWCRRCHAGASARWREANRDAILAKRRQHYAEHAAEERARAAAARARRVDQRLASEDVRMRDLAARQRAGRGVASDRDRDSTPDPALVALLPITADGAASRRATAVHEAAHAVAYLLFGGPPSVVSIRAGRQYAGITVAQVPRPGRNAFDPDHLVLQQPEELRRSVEREIIGRLAGDLAARALGPEPVGYVGPDRTAQEAQLALEALPPRSRELLDAHESRREPMDADEQSAWHLAHAFAGPAAAPFYLEWLRAEAAELLGRHRAAILRVADELERREVLDGDEVAALVYRPKGDPNGNQD